MDFEDVSTQSGIHERSARWHVALSKATSLRLKLHKFCALIILARMKKSFEYFRVALCNLTRVNNCENKNCVRAARPYRKILAARSPSLTLSLGDCADGY